LCADKNYDTKAFVANCHKRKVTPHVAQKKYTEIDSGIIRHVCYKTSIKKHKRIEGCFGWALALWHRKEASSPAISAHDSCLQSGQNMAIIDVVHQEPAKNAGKQEIPR
jgi:hypothetical protein